MTAPALPRLRPVPVLEPWPAIGVLTDVPEPAPSPGQGVLTFPADARTPALPDFSVSSGEASSPVVRVSGGPAKAWALRFTQVTVEVIAGLRPPAQLLRWTSEEVLETLRRRHALARRAPGPPRRGVVRSVHVCQPVSTVAEVAAVVSDGERSRAIAFRMEGTATRWRVTALELG